MNQATKGFASMDLPDEVSCEAFASTPPHRPRTMDDGLALLRHPATTSVASSAISSADLQPPTRAGSLRVDGVPFRLKRRPEERVRLLGGEVDLVKAAEVFHFMKQRVDSGQKAVIANHNLHSLLLKRKIAELDAFFRAADLIEVDSTPLIFWARLLGLRSRRFHRCTYLDWRNEFWNLVQQQDWRVFFVGGSPGVADAASEEIQKLWPDAKIQSHHGFFDVSEGSAENQAVIAQIRQFKPHILLVGMGMPRQELWIKRNYHQLPACVALPVGGAFDYEAGVQIQAPRWLGQIGAEWVFRLSANPKRMFRRYCIEPFGLIPAALLDIWAVLRHRLRNRRRRS